MKQVDYCGEYDEVDLLACERILGKLEETPPEEGDDFWDAEEQNQAPIWGLFYALLTRTRTQLDPDPDPDPDAA